MVVFVIFLLLWGVHYIFCWWPFTWSSKKIRTTVCLSSTGAEYIAASNAVLEILWLHHLFEFMNLNHEPTVLFIDNQPAIKLAQHPVQHSRTKTY